MRHRTGPAERPAIADDNAPLPPARRPTRWTVRRGRAIAFVLLGLALAAALLSVYFTYKAAQSSAAQAQESKTRAAAVDRRLSVLEADLAERTRQRDAERDAAAARAEADRELFRTRFCEVLAELSTTFPKLEPLEAALGCATHAAPAGGTPAPTGAGSPATPAPASSTSTPAAPAPPAPTPPPAVPPSEPPPSTPGLLCGLLPSLC